MINIAFYHCTNLIYHCTNLIYHCTNLFYHCTNLIYHCTNWLSLHLRIIPELGVLSFKLKTYNYRKIMIQNCCEQMNNSVAVAHNSHETTKNLFSNSQGRRRPGEGVRFRWGEGERTFCLLKGGRG